MILELSTIYYNSCSYKNKNAGERNSVYQKCLSISLSCILFTWKRTSFKQCILSFIWLARWATKFRCQDSFNEINMTFLLFIKNHYKRQSVPHEHRWSDFRAHTCASCISLLGLETYSSKLHSRLRSRCFPIKGHFGRDSRGTCRLERSNQIWIWSEPQPGSRLT